MQHKEPSYIRKGKTLLYAPSRTVAESFKSISQAKRRSRELQQANGGRGMGYVRVER
jgi:hypothetical protein